MMGSHFTAKGGREADLCEERKKREQNNNIYILLIKLGPTSIHHWRHVNNLETKINIVALWVNIIRKNSTYKITTSFSWSQTCFYSPQSHTTTMQLSICRTQTALAPAFVPLWT